ncbi:YqzE family protein [Paenibacillus nasutitermitis]|uniref:YqzE family protein n=1 Tax=Paenibacillus nasutitermitis TaxID=1652958 RepID=A0A916YR09_9BACL|nr:YqzE family protein [Paenibacillus nasutitermitis]GGD56593.1 YqzE family protein [Paenibacillus nasutitermitis]
MADTDEYVKYMTERFIHYVETPKEIRKQTRETAKTSQEPWLTKWFGVAPIGLALWWRSRIGREDKDKRD